jgi:hypothetical protein
MTERHTDRWWSVRLPDGWSGRVDDDTTILSASDGPGMLQVRSFLSEGRDIEDDDLRELAKPHTDQGALLRPIRYGGGFTGFFVHYEAEGNLWWEWWLRCRRLAIHVTYHCPVEARTQEEATVAAVLNSLRLEAKDPGAAS